MSQSQSAEKLERGDPLGFLKLQLSISKNFEKSRTVAKKNFRTGDPIVSSGFVSYDKNGVTERGDPLHYLKCAPRLPIQYFSSSAKSVHYAYKRKKTCHCNSRAHFDKMRRLKKKAILEL